MEEEISSTLSKLMLEGEFYKNINPELQNGLTKFYKDINSASKEAGSGISMDKKKTEALFTEAPE
jgi:chemotaxis protein CheZ